MNSAPHIKPVLERALAAFRDKFGHAPTFAASAPGRVNLIGEHTDYSGGFVLPMAIDRVCVAVAAPAMDPGKSRVYALDLAMEGRFDARHPIELAQPNSTPGGIERGAWLSYIAGVAAQFQRLASQHAELPNLDIAVTSSVPFGSGLSSSASLEVAIATIFEAAVGARLKPQAKALLCQTAEHEFAGVPCGIMDQFISVMGREGHALLIDCQSQESRPIPMPSADAALIVVINTNVHHELASGEYANRRQVCEAAAAKLGVAQLRELSSAQFEELAKGAGLTQQEAACARHVVTENERAQQAAAAFAKGDLVAFGRLMAASHASLRDDFRVSCAELDCVVEAAAAVPGVYGARMTGGGFGGCAIALADPRATKALIERVAAAYRANHYRDCTAFEVSPAGGACQLAL